MFVSGGDASRVAHDRLPSRRVMDVTGFMSMSFGIVLPLWNLTDGPPDLLERAVGEIGLEHLTAPVVTGPVTQFRLSERVDTPAWRTEGGWHYTPDKARYAGALRPHVAQWVARRRPLEQLMDFARKHALRVFLRVDLTRVPTLAQGRPDLCCRDAWGAAMSADPLCASQPQVRELARETLDELAGYQPAGFQFESVAPCSADHPLAWTRGAERELSACFCSACREGALRAGFEQDELAALIHAVQRRIRAAAAGATSADATLSEGLDRYSRAVDTEGWLARLRAHVAPRPFLSAARPRRGANESAESSYGEASSWRRLQCWRPAFALASDLVRRVAELTASGARDFDFEGLDEAPDEALDWLRQAVRYARREAPL